MMNFQNTYEKISLRITDKNFDNFNNPIKKKPIAKEDKFSLINRLKPSILKIHKPGTHLQPIISGV